ncbi:polyprenol phosphomannose-dependent alpha 1,6 mannosyltransferase MptB [Citricoccus sp. GCM10030269]|uniref:polyprenol phosphomannose-dependent alpha 1,6 mannosyltransferase MptB n=1 Tax=Citricoccus sp. GCM10030269 TaxID=3273388 RepID=UPI00361C9080
MSVPSTRTEPASPTWTPAVWIAGVVGFLGSLAVLAGSLSVGWLASISPVNRWSWLIPWRTTEYGVITGTVMLTLGCWLMFWGWLRLGKVVRFSGRGGLGIVNITTAAWSLPLLACLPIFSRDIFAYIGQGRLMVAGQDPYESGISTLSNWFQLGADATWAQTETPYGPVFLWIEQFVMAVAGPDDPDLAIFLFRLTAVAGVVLIMVYVPKLATLLGTDAARAQWITTANPLLLISFVASGHNDALMTGLAVAGVWYAATGRGLLGVLLVTASMGIKPITMVLLPFIGLLWAGRGASWARRFGYWFLTAGISGLIMVLVGMLNGFGYGWLTVMLTTGTGSVPWSPLGIMADATKVILNSLGLADEWVLSAFKTIGRILSVIIVIWLMFRGRHEHLMQRLTWAFTALVVLTPIIQPWYLLWLLPFFAVIGIRDDWQLKWVVFTVAFFLAFGAADQLFVWQFLGIGDQLAHLATLLSWGCMVWILLLDPWTSSIMKEEWHVRPALRRAVARLRRSERTPDETSPRKTKTRQGMTPP